MQTEKKDTNLITKGWNYSKKKLQQGFMAKCIATEYDVSESAISYIKGQQSKILETMSNSAHEVKKKA